MSQLPLSPDKRSLAAGKSFPFFSQKLQSRLSHVNHEHHSAAAGAARSSLTLSCELCGSRAPTGLSWTLLPSLNHLLACTDQPTKPVSPFVRHQAFHEEAQSLRVRV